MLFFVAGITGNVGGAAARRLLDQGHTLRALVRDPQKAAVWTERGVEVRNGDFNDPAALAAAFHAVEGAFLMLAPLFAPSPGYPEAKATIASFQEALRQAPPPRVVLLSSVGSQQESGLGNITTTHLLEQGLGNLSIPTAFVRAGGFFENYLNGLDSTAATGIHYSFYQPLERAVPMVATADIGNEVARLLVDSWTGKKTVELGSPVSPNEIAGAMGKALGRPVEARPVPRERWAATLESFGLAPGTTANYEEMVDGFNSGWIDFGVPGTEKVAATMSAKQFFEKARK